MKNLARIIAILIAFCGIVLIINEATHMGTDFQSFAYKINTLFELNLFPAIAIAACAYCLERNDSNYILRIIPIYMLIPIIMSILMALFEIDAEWFIKVYMFIYSTLPGVTILSIIYVIKPNNKITIILRYIAFALLAANVLMTLISWVKVYLVETLPNVYGYKNYGGFNFSTIEETNDFVSKVAAVTSVAQKFVLLLLFITNYAFSDKIELEADEIDYEAVKNDAMDAANTQMNNLYNRNTVKEEVIDRSASEKGLMNVNNQLGQDSNVGTVKTQAREMNVSGSTLDSLITLSSGPVANEQMAQTTTPEQQKVQEQQVTTEPPTTPPNVDIQEEMKRKLQEATPQQNTQPPVQEQNNVQ